MVICGGTIHLRLLVRGKYMFPDCSGAATGDGVINFAGRDETSSSELGVELGIKVNLHTPRCNCEGNVSRDWYGEHVSRLYRCCRVVARSGAFTTIWALMVMGGYGPV